MKRIKLIKFKELLNRYHGEIHRFLISYSTEDSPQSEFESLEYQKWLADTNKDFKIAFDSHDYKDLTEYKELVPYLDKKVHHWQLFDSITRSETILEVDLDD